MKKVIILTVMMLVGMSTNAQSKYDIQMEKAFDLWQTNNTTEALSIFERIGKVETDNWLPYYYSASILVIKSFSESNEEKRVQKLERASLYVEKIKAMNNDISEVLVIEAFVKTGYVAYKPMVYGAKLSSKIIELYYKAIKLNPENPRAYSGLAEYQIGGAKFMGGPIDSFCELNNKALEKYKTFKHSQKFYPKWGEERSKYIRKQCGESENEKESKHSINIDISNIKTDKGVVNVSIYNEDGFMHTALKHIDSKINQGKSIVSFENMEPGEYAIVCFHDENVNGRLDFDKNGIPLEEYGAINELEYMESPEFSSSKFELKDKDVRFEVKL
ncbi:MAG: DUF2141 domain-containing protein [Flavobacteriaceae bacterium]|nr:DUF2141 domain-containing protein [Flavobacteriaceae bacterium]